MLQVAGGVFCPLKPRLLTLCCGNKLNWTWKWFWWRRRGESKKKDSPWGCQAPHQLVTLSVPTHMGSFQNWLPFLFLKKRCSFDQGCKKGKFGRSNESIPNMTKSLKVTFCWIIIEKKSRDLNTPKVASYKHLLIPHSDNFQTVQYEFHSSGLWRLNMHIL